MPPFFEDMLGPLPATEEAVLSELRSDLQAQGSRIANTSPFSPFFRLMGALLAQPVLFVRGLLRDTVLPGMFVKTATGEQLDALAYGLDEQRKPATKATGLLTFYRDNPTGDLGIPAGAVVASPPIEGVVYRMLTTAAGLITEGSLSAQVSAEAEQPGAAWNLGDGYYAVLEDTVPGITAVANASGWLTQPGTDTEGDEPLRERLRLKWRRQAG
ncbi:MAG: baseplate J/gp47 family protein [Anaerolineae bacterium]|nr:baseplate J/gp47 family protein [Anaerolineae bacterium]